MSHDGYEFHDEQAHGLSTKQLGFIFAVIVLGLFILFAFFIFPIQNLFRETISEEVTVISKSGLQCAIDSKDHPRSIDNCKYNVGDKLEITYKDGTIPIISHYKINQ